MQSLVRAEAHWHSGQEGQEKPSTDPKGCPVLELLSSNPSLNPDSPANPVLSHLHSSMRQLLALLCVQC